MAQSRGSGDERRARGTGAKRATPEGMRHASGQQTGSKRPAPRVGAHKQAPKKGDIPPKGTRGLGAPKKSSSEG